MTDQTEIPTPTPGRDVPLPPFYPAPQSMRWVGPGGYSVQLDEDGVSLWPGKGPLEHLEVDQLINLLSDVLATRANGLARVPVAPTREELASGSYSRQVARTWREVQDVIQREICANNTNPF